MVLMTEDFAGIPEDRGRLWEREEVWVIGPYWGTDSTVHGWVWVMVVLLRCDLGLALKPRCMEVPPSECPMHIWTSSNTSFSSSPSLSHPNLLFHLSQWHTIHPVPKSEKWESSITDLSFFHPNSSLTVIALTSWVFIEYVLSSPSLLCILSSFSVQIISCLWPCLSQTPPTLLPE